jgi:hypothetical protein
MRRLILAAAVVLGTSGCWIDACVIEREPFAADLCRDVVTTLWEDDEPPPDGFADPDACEGEWREFQSCDDLDFTEPCGRFVIKPGKECG